MAEYDPPPAYPPPPPPPVEAPAAEEAEPVDEFDDTDPSALSDFKQTLDPYGYWVDEPTYGYVWVPSQSHVGADFAPYVTGGRWSIDTSGDWVWVSDYDDSFGWVVFHYGRWVWVSGHGWVWIPGRRYAPAWVVWRVGDPGYGYIGWAPAPPLFYWRYGAVVWFDYYPPAPYVFCPTTHVFHHHVHTHIVPRDRIAEVAGPTRPYGSPGGPAKHALATPHKGPSVQSGHVPPEVWPSTPHTANPKHSNFATPQGMGRPLPTPKPGHQPGGHVDAPQRAPVPGRQPFRAPGGEDGVRRVPSPSDPPRRAPSHVDPPRRIDPPGRPSPPSYSPPSRPSPPSYSPPSRPSPPSYSPPPSRPSPPPSRPSPPPRAAPPSRPSPPPRAAPPPSRPSSPPSRSSPSPSRSSPSRGGSGPKRR